MQKNVVIYFGKKLTHRNFGAAVSKDGASE